jgi:beta-glucanase (GH16 family)
VWRREEGGPRLCYDGLGLREEIMILVGRLRTVAWALLGALSLLGARSQEKSRDLLPGGPGRPGWKLVWSDEFDTDGAPDPKKWTYEEGFVRNGEKQFYTVDRRENARVEKGNLVIEGRKEHYTSPKPGPGGKPHTAEYTSASLTTAKSASFTYGRIEARAKIPHGRGTWPALWMLGINIGQVGWPKCGEIDILENVGFDPDGIHTTVHTEAYNHPKKTQKGKRTERPKPYDAFHVYAIEWTKEKIDFYFDEEKVFTFENEGKGEATWPFDKPQYLILNFAIGGAWGGQKGIDETIFPQQFLIDYVRVYEAAAGDAKKPK